jgi:hypothetical protein
MTRTFTVLLIAATAIGVVATPGLAAVALLIIPLAVLVAVWWTSVGMATHGRRVEAVVRLRDEELLGPGGPDDPFAVRGASPSPGGTSVHSVRRHERVRDLDRGESGHLSAGDSVDGNGVQRRVAGRRDPEVPDDPV